MELQFHPLANIFPLIEGEDFDALVADIRANGLQDTIVLHSDGRILDGRNRYMACEAAGVDARLEMFHGADPLAFVISKNLKRRHLDASQRAFVAAKLANLDQGRPSDNPANLPDSSVSQSDAAALLNVSERSLRAAKAVQRDGVEELQRAVERGDIAVSAAEKIADLPEPVQRDEVARINGARALMASRQEPGDSLDYFPTPPFATRALVEFVLPEFGVVGRDLGSVWEPACGEGHIAGVLREYTDKVRATDIFDYQTEHQNAVRNFLTGDDAPGQHDWIITNPPFDEEAIQFVLRAIELAGVGVAMFVRLQWIEGIGRYERLFRPTPPTVFAPFVERVPLCKGRWDPDGGTATAYCWLVWIRGIAPRAPFWIPHGCRKSLTLPTDRERFAKWSIPIDASGSPLIHDGDGVVIEEASQE